jgi:hypothetical protein
VTPAQAEGGPVAVQAFHHFLSLLKQGLSNATQRVPVCSGEQPLLRMDGVAKIGELFAVAALEWACGARGAQLDAVIARCTREADSVVRADAVRGQPNTR